MIRTIDWAREGLYLTLIGMDACWIGVPLAVLDLLASQGKSSGIGALTLFAVGVIAFYAGRWLASLNWRPIDVQVVMIVVALLVALIAIRIDLFGAYAPLDFSWLPAMAGNFWNLSDPVEIVALIAAIFMWFRVSRLQPSMLSSDIVLGRFQFGMAWIIGGLLFGILSKQLPANITVLLMAYFFCGLLAVSMSRMNVLERRVHQRSWLGITVAATVVILLAAALATASFSHDTLQMLMGPINFLANIVGAVLYVFLMIVGLLLEAIIYVIYAIISLFPRSTKPEDQQLAPAPSPPKVELEQTQSDPTFAFISRLIVVALLVAFIVWLLLRSFRRNSREEEDGVEETHESVFDPSLLKNAAADALRNLRDRLFGSRPVVDTFDRSPVQRIRRAYRDLLQYTAETYQTSRPPYRTPTEHLPVLEAELPGERGELDRLTELYIDARYAESSLGPTEAEQAEQMLAHVKQQPEQNSHGRPP